MPRLSSTSFRNPLVLLLIGASVLSGRTGDIASTVIILAIVLASVTLDFIQEHRAESTLALPFSPVAPHVGFVAPPPLFYAVLGVLVAGYLSLVQVCKQHVYRAHHEWRRRAAAPAARAFR